MCHQSGGLIARGLEAAGIPTVTLGNLPDRLERVRVPRGATVKFPRGATVGPPGNAAMQMDVLRATLAHLAGAGQGDPVLEMPFKWEATP